MPTEFTVPKPNGRAEIQPWYSHLPVLVTVMERLRPLTILEMGAGDASTILLHSYVVADSKRSLLTLEHDPKWMQDLAWQACPQHEFKLIGEAWDLTPYDNRSFDFIFIDQAPEPARIHSLEWASRHGRVTAVHDENYSDRYGKHYGLFDSHVDYSVYWLHTGVFGKGVDVTAWWR